MGKLNNQNGAKAPFLKAQPRAAPSNPDLLPPAFSFEKMQDGSGNSFNCCEDDDRLALVKRIFMLSREPWRKIRAAPNKGMGSEEISRRQIKHGIPKLVTDDVDYFHSLYYMGKKRFVGYKVGQVFYVLWIDHNFKVYNHG
jgi:hypothetical protein